MRILLIQALSTLDCKELVFPLGLARLSASLGGCHEVRGIDLNLNPFPWPDLIGILNDFKPEVVAVSFRNLDPLEGSSVSFVPHLKTLAALIKEHSPESKVILGGSGFTLFSKRLMKEVPEAHLGFCGEADSDFPLLAKNLNTPWNVFGTLWRRGDEIMGDNCAVSCRGSLDDLPFPDWQIFDPRRYQNLNRYVAFMGVETKRGCPHNCRYCLYPALQGSHFRLRAPERVVDELETLNKSFQIKLVHFTDPVVNQPIGHLRAICREILRRRLNIGWTGFFREDYLSAEDMELYRKSGLVACYFSGDGASNWALNLLGKGLSQDDILLAARAATDSGVLTIYHFLVNLPGETQQTVDDTRSLLERLFEIHSKGGKLGAVVLNNLRLYPGAALTKAIMRDRLIDPNQDLLYPTYFNPPPWDSLRHELTAYCMKEGMASYMSNRDSAGFSSDGKDSDANCSA
jgi:anaerobic magnesium-protoporphyrin IX monomethyl ester cyclase